MDTLSVNWTSLLLFMQSHWSLHILPACIRLHFLQNENEIMEAMEGMDTLIQESNQSVREVAKLADSKEVCVR